MHRGSRYGLPTRDELFRSCMYGEGYEAMRFANPAVRHRLEVMERIILLRTRGCQRVLDLGCGTGRFTAQLRVREVIGLDKSRAMLSVARRRELACVLGDAHALPFGDREFDAVISTDHVFGAIDVERALPEAHRVLSPGGLLAIHYPAHAIWTPRKPFGLTLIPGPRRKAAAEVIAIAETLGFRVDARQLWRWLRWYPYLVPMPPWTRLPIWNGGVLLFRK